MVKCYEPFRFNTQRVMSKTITMAGPMLLASTGKEYNSDGEYGDAGGHDDSANESAFLHKDRSWADRSNFFAQAQWSVHLASIK